MPSRYDDQKLNELTRPIAASWQKFIRTYRLDTTNPGHMVAYAAQLPGRLEQILRTHTTLSEVLIQKTMERPSGLEYNLDGDRGNLTQFEARAVMAALADLYEKEKYKPQVRSVPITILLGAILSSYDFEDQRATVVVNRLSTAGGMPDQWWKAKSNGERIPLGSIIYLNIPEEQASEIYSAAKSNPSGRNIVYIGAETSFPLAAKSGPIDIERVVFSFSWNLSNPFFVFDVAAKKKEIEDVRIEKLKVELKKADDFRRALEGEQRAREEEQRAIAQELESEGFNRDEDAARFESAGLAIGAPAPVTLTFTRYETSGFKSIQSAQNGSNFPAASAFFHTIIEGGQVAFFTSDGQAQSPVVYYARYFSDNSLSAEVLKNAAIKKLGQPQYSGAKDAYWWDARLPEDVSVGCRPKIAEVLLGNTTVRNNQWPRHPLSIDFNEFSENCGIVGAMNFSSKKYAVADTTFFNQVLSEALVAEQQLAKDLAAKVAADKEKAAAEKEKAQALEAKAEKEFEF